MGKSKDWLTALNRITEETGADPVEVNEALEIFKDENLAQAALELYKEIGDEHFMGTQTDFFYSMRDFFPRSIIGAALSYL